MSRPQVDYKTSLTFKEGITAAFLYYVRGVDQQNIAIAMGGVNMARVNEACKLVSEALNPKEAAVVVDIFEKEAAASDG